MDNKTFIHRLSAATGTDQRQTAVMAEALADIIKQTVAATDSVAIPSFGTFTGVKHDESVSTDLTTGKRMLLPPQITIEFTPAAMLRKKLNENE